MRLPAVTFQVGSLGYGFNGRLAQAYRPPARREHYCGDSADKVLPNFCRTQSSTVMHGTAKCNGRSRH
jgi:hypothetical protein